MDSLKLERELGVPSAIGLMVGTMIGSSIFISPSSVLMNSGSVALSLLLWVVPALLTLLIILCFMELASISPKAGAEYVYFREAFGDMAGFLFAWTNAVILLPAFYAILAMTATHYVMSYASEECISSPGAVVLSIWLLLSIAALNTIYLKYTTRVQIFLTSLKVVALFIIITSGIVQIAKGHTHHLMSGFEGSNWSAGSIASSIQVGVFSYFGWQGMFSVIEEIKSPKKTVPISIAVTMGLVTTLYLFTNIAYFSVMSPDDIIASKAVAMTFAARTLGGFSVVIPLCVALNVIGTLNASILAGSRVYFAAGRDGLFPAIFACIHVEYRTPVPAVAVMSLVSVVYIMSGDTHLLIQCQGITLTINFILIAVAVIYLKRSRPSIARPVPVPMIIPVLSLILAICLFVLGVYQQPFESLIVMAIILSGIPFYVMTAVWKEKPKMFERFPDRITTACQKALRLGHADQNFEMIY